MRVSACCLRRCKVLLVRTVQPSACSTHGGGSLLMVVRCVLSCAGCKTWALCRWSIPMRRVSSGPCSCPVCCGMYCAVIHESSWLPGFAMCGLRSFFPMRTLSSPMHCGTYSPPSPHCWTLARYRRWLCVAHTITVGALCWVRWLVCLAMAYSKSMVWVRPMTNAAARLVPWQHSFTHCLNRQVLETLATFVEPSGDWSQLAASAETQRELFNLENRCRYRERLRNFVGTVLCAQLNAGVRVLFSGPSGTGKTLAARLLASVLHIDLYRLDLSTVVNKYIGETEKNLNRVFALVEELDVILLLDEGDALLTRRTNVQTSNDRYANLETNYLLQRLETFEGILIVTTNASERIDSAFQRRLDMVIDFLPPEAAERWVIWQLHLPAAHAIDLPLLQEIVARCNLTGGQIRNVVLHASLLGLSDGGMITSAHLEAALQREYRKMGAIYPLRRQFSALSDWR